jgi:alpha-mannosidase
VQLSSRAEWLKLEPQNLILTAMKKAEDEDNLVLRFYEAEGRGVDATIRLAKPLRRAWRTSLIEEEQEPLPTSPDGALRIQVRPWEIVTVKVAV